MSTNGLDLSFGGENGNRFLAAERTPLIALVTLPIAPRIPLAILLTMFDPADLNRPKKLVTALRALRIPLITALRTALKAFDTMPRNELKILVNVLRIPFNIDVINERIPFQTELVIERIAFHIDVTTDRIELNIDVAC